MTSLLQMPAGDTYSTVYGAWLDIFRKAAEEGGEFTDVPKCWAPLLLYFGADVQSVRDYFICDWWLADPLQAFNTAAAEGRQREYVEHICALRPELVDSLWKADCEWNVSGRRHETQKEFVIANYSAFYRPEIQEFIRKVDRWELPRDVRCAVVTNCSADKPYPAVLHTAIQERLPRGWTMLIATGVLGVVPVELWPDMPLYDSGMPNFWRCMERWEAFLGRTHLDAIVVYTEFYSRSLHRALSLVAGRTFIHWVTPAGPYNGYLELLDPPWIGKLEDAISLAEEIR